MTIAAFDELLARRGFEMATLTPFADALRVAMNRELDSAADDAPAADILAAIERDEEVRAAARVAFGDTSADASNPSTVTLDAIQAVLYSEEAAQHVRGVHLRDFVQDVIALRVARALSGDDLLAVRMVMLGAFAVRALVRPQPMLWTLVQVLNYAVDHPTFAIDEDDEDNLPPMPTVM